MKTNRLSKLSLAIGLSIASTSALASPQGAMSARSFAMGGTGVAVAHPSAAPLANPAMMAAPQHSWADDFGLMLPSVNARFADEEDVIDQIDDIQDVIDQFDSIANGFDSTTSADEVARFQNTARDLSNRLGAFSNDTMRVNLGLGLGVAIPSPRLAVGVFTNGNLTATVRGELDNSDRGLLDRIASANSASDIDTILNDPTEVQRDEDGNIVFNSRGKILASAVIEAGVSFATTFQLNNGDDLQVGVSPKYVELRTFQYTETVSGFDDDDFDSDDSQTDKSGFNLDLGAAYAFGDNKEWNAGVVVRNLIPMKLDSAQSRGPVIEDKYTLELKPMITTGIAHTGDYHVVTAELDLTKKKAFGFEDDTQWLAVGAELDAWRYAQLRLGMRHNLASNSDNDGIEEKTQFTVGLGLNVLGARVDLGGLFSSAEVGAAIELGTSF